MDGVNKLIPDKEGLAYLLNPLIIFTNYLIADFIIARVSIILRCEIYF